MTEKKDTKDFGNEYFFLKMLAGLYVKSQEDLIQYKYLSPILNYHPDKGFTEASPEGNKELMEKHLGSIKLLFEKENSGVGLPALRELVVDLLDGAITYYQEIFRLLDNSLKDLNKDDATIKNPS